FGEHDLDIVSTDGFATTTFTIPGAEVVGGSTATGDNTPYIPFGLVILVLVIGGPFVVLRKCLKM
ncbi:MAG: hypothetical protein MJ189_03990, partial [Coriobacteriales bacterium]|nr:hypothetical protein [Coriobacteriales bacterium]